LIFKGLRRYGYHDIASELAERCLELLHRFGFWEYYHPLTGQGLGGSTFSWAAVMLDMVATARGS
jgi:alpha,alpha-trehalase